MTSVPRGASARRRCHEQHARADEHVLAHLQSDLAPDSCRGETAPRGLAPPDRLGRAGDVVSDHRMHAVGADQHVPGGVAPVGEPDRDPVRILIDGHATGAEGNVLIAHRGAQHIVQVGPMHVVEGRPPTQWCGLAEGHPSENVAALPVALVPRQ